MSLAGILSDAASAWLIEAGGVSGAYYTATEVINVTVVIERDVTTVDNVGGYVRSNIASIASGLVTCPRSGDYIIADGVRWSIEELVDDPGHIMRLSVRRA